MRHALRAWAGCRRFRRLPAAERDLVFYAEDRGSWSHLGPVVRELTEQRGRAVAYLTSDPHDPRLVEEPPGVRVCFIGRGVLRTHLFMALGARVMVLTMPDLETFHLKRSRTHPVHYMYLFHSMVSTHMIYRPAAFDHYDTVLCVGPHHLEELRARERLHELPPRRLVAHGYGRLDDLLESVPVAGAGQRDAQPVHVTVAPSWGPQGLLETRGVELVDLLLASGHAVTVRPHPRTARGAPRLFRELRARHRGNPRFALDLDMSDSASLFAADVLVSDWSGAALEYAFVRERPVLFVDVPRKVNNPDYERLGLEPLEVSVRNEIGEIISPGQLADAPAAVARLCAERRVYRERIAALRDRTVFHVGRSAAMAADAIIEQLEQPLQRELAER